MITIGIIGLGFGKAAHIPAFQKDKRFKIIGVCSKNLDKAKKVSKEYNIDYYTDNSIDLIDKVDAISIAIPPNDQKKILPIAIDKGKHIFFEKPLGYIPKKKIYLKKNQALMINFEFLEIDVWKKFSNILNSNVIGKVLHVNISWIVQTYSFANNTNSWKVNLNSGGGVINNFSPHVFHYIENIFGKIKKVSTFPHNYQNTNRFVDVNLLLEKKISVNLSLSNDTFKGSGHKIEVTASKGTIILQNTHIDSVANFVLDIKSNNKKEIKIFSKLKRDDFSDQRIGPMLSLVKRFGNWIEKGKICRPNINDAVRNQKIINSVKKSYSLKKIVSIN